MILALELRHFKTYNGKQYIPISSLVQKFSTFIGDNGIGKSSILEALDVLFNNREWNINLEAKNKGGLSEGTRNQPYICGLFLIEKERITNIKLKDICNDITQLLIDKNIEKNTFFNEIDEFKNSDLKETHFLILNGKQFNNNKIDIPYFGSLDRNIKEIIQNSSNVNQENLEKQDKRNQGKLERKYESYFNDIKKLYSYIYIPTEVSISEFTKIEKDDIQKLTGKNIFDEISKIISPKKLDEINKNLNTLVEKISTQLNEYEFKTSQHRNKNIQMQSLISKIIEEFFSLRVLTKKSNRDEDIYVEYLSSGEKRKALIELSKAFLMTQKKDDKYIIFAFDEPEASLNRKARFKQFEELKQIKNISENIQLLIATHWYGHLSIINNGISHLLHIKNNDFQVDSYSLFNAREIINQTKNKNYKDLPNDVTLKSVNDLTQSIVTSLQAEEPYNWLICEGSSEKIYFDFYFKDMIEKNHLIILPVGSFKEVKRIFEYLELPFRDYKESIKGKVYCLIDTDKQRLDFAPIIDEKSKLIFHRLLNDNNKTNLVKNDDDKNTETEIEDSLNSNIFIETLKSFKDENINKILEDNKSIKKDESLNSYYRFDIRNTDRELIKDFFDKNNGYRKIEFAKKYVELAKDTRLLAKLKKLKWFTNKIHLNLLDYQYHLNEFCKKSTDNIPEWINEIKNFFIDSVKAKS